VYPEIIGTIFASLGGASVIVAGFAHLLGKIWADRIAKTASAKFSIELESVKANNLSALENIKSNNTTILEEIKSINTIALEDFKRDSSILLSDREQFGGISLDFYQDFFKKRIEIYLKLLEIKNSYITETHEDFITEIHDGRGQIYHSTYISIRELIIKNQLYISNELEQVFSKLRMEASTHIKQADYEEAHSYKTDNPQGDNQRLQNIYDEFASSTNSLMNEIMNQVGLDVSKLRSRIELDKA
jgi:hypothetical protein